MCIYNTNIQCKINCLFHISTLDVSPSKVKKTSDDLPNKKIELINLSTDQVEDK